MGRKRPGGFRARGMLVALLTVGLLAGAVVPAMADGGVRLTISDSSRRLMARLVWQSSPVEVVRRGRPDLQRQLTITASDERDDDRVVCVKVEMRVEGDRGWRLLDRRCARREPQGLRYRQRIRWDGRLDCQVRVTLSGLDTRRDRERSDSTTANCRTA